jgi:hypothetical protein
MRRGKEGARSPSLGCHTDPNDRSDRPAIPRPRRSLPAPRRSGASSPVRACLTSLGREHGGACAERRATSMNSHRNPLRPPPAMLSFNADQRERFPERQGRPLAGGVSVRSTSNGATIHRTMKRMEARVSFREPGQPCRRSAPVALASTPFVHASPAFNLPPPCLRRQNSSSSPVAIGTAFTTLAITSAGYFSALCPLGIGDHLWVSRADFAFADFSIGTKDDPPPHLIKFCTRHDFCVLRIAPAAFLPSPLVKHSAPPMLLPLSIWERA